ncbi:MAG TPA: hypothetical protein VFI41_04510 [Gemmatimonadales bacterium]|nr:hypothetical protein [Gemmatimonadales bacterium]
MEYTVEDPALSQVHEEEHQGIDARQNPDAANQAVADIFAASTRDTAVIEDPPDGSVELPGGYIHPADGKLYAEAEVRELTGVDEEMLAKPEVTKSLGRFTQLLLQRGVTRIGPFENPSNSIIGSLLVGDRDMLLVAIRRATYGDDLEMEVGCPACGEQLDLKYDLGKDIPVKQMENPLERAFTYTTKKGRQLQANLAVGVDQEAILNASNKTVPELNTLLLSRCVMDKAGVPLGVEGIRALGIHDRRELLKQITERQPGPKYQSLDITCPVCAKEFPLSLTLYDLFR